MLATIQASYANSISTTTVLVKMSTNLERFWLKRTVISNVALS